MHHHLLVADVLGFTKIVRNLSQATGEESSFLKERVDQWINLVNSVQIETGVTELRLISDTVLVLEDFSHDGLGRLLRFSKLLLEIGIQHSFPVRGAITHGEVHWGDLIYGQPILDALHLEKSQEWIGIAGAAGMNMPWSWDLVCCYPVPKKTGSIELLPSIVWSVPEREELEQRTGSGGLSKVGDKIPWEHQSKLINTLLFGKYLSVGKCNDLDAGNFFLNSPAHVFSFPK